MPKILVIIHNTDGRPCAWGYAADQNDAIIEAKRMWHRHSCYEGEERGKVTVNDLDAFDSAEPMEVR